MLRAYDATVRYVDQGGNKRPGAFTIYIELWHSDIFETLSSSTFGRTTEKKKLALVTFSILSGSQIFCKFFMFASLQKIALNILIAWGVLSRTAIGPCSAQMKHQTCMKSMELNSKSCTDDTSNSITYLHKLQVPSITSI